MGSVAPGVFDHHDAPAEAAQQCRIRDVNEATELVNETLTTRETLRCECGDLACHAHVASTHDEYEAVRAYGSHFIVVVNHENPESCCVLTENARFAVIDVVVGDSRYHVLALNPRHAWTDPPDWSP